MEEEIGKNKLCTKIHKIKDWVRSRKNKLCSKIVLKLSRPNWYFVFSTSPVGIPSNSYCVIKKRQNAKYKDSVNKENKRMLQLQSENRITDV